jgi:hypothetical protein
MVQKKLACTFFSKSRENTFYHAQIDGKNAEKTIRSKGHDLNLKRTTSLK